MGYCDWDLYNEKLIRYHDEEWGIPLHDDRRQFEFLMMEVMQCGLNWRMMMDKREIFRACFDGFDYDRVAEYGEEDVGRILQTEGMIRSRRKIEAVIQDARCFQQIRAEFGSFSEYLWGWTDGRAILYERHAQGYVPSSNGLSEDISRDLKKRGFRYLGAITVYSHLQACGIINDHDENCPCYRRLLGKYPTAVRPGDREKGTRYYR